MRIALLLAACVTAFAPLVDAADAPTAPDGAKIYEQACRKCHNGGPGGFFTGAPKLGSKEWQARVAKAASPDALFASVRNGKGKMPPQLGGELKLGEAELRAATDYMLSR